MASTLKILIADDQRLFADGLAVVIESRAPEFKIIGIAENGQRAVTLANERRPDIILMDVRMPGMDGVEATRLIHKQHPEIKILILTTFPDDDYVERSLEHGAIGYLLKSRPAEEVIESIRVLAKGIMQIDPEVSSVLLRAKRTADEAETELRARLETLSTRERQVIRCMIQAKRVTAIAGELGIAEQTVRNHISNIYFKLNIHDRLEIVNYIHGIRSFLDSVP